MQIYNDLEVIGDAIRNRARSQLFSEAFENYRKIKTMWTARLVKIKYFGVALFNF
jgi:hypothetical protein